MKRSTIHIAMAVLLTCGMSSAQAGIAPPSIGLSARAEVVASGIGETDFNNSSTPAVADKIFSNGGVSGEAHAIADYGILKASATLTKAPGVEPFNFGTGEAIFSEVLTITGGTGTSTIAFHFKNTGSLSVPGGNGAEATSELNVFFTDGSFQSDNQQYLINSGNSEIIDDSFTTTAFNFTYGVPFSFDVRLTANVSLEETDAGTVTSDFFNTAEIEFVEVGGDPIEISVTSDSGTIYAVPEPATALIVGAGLLLWGRRR